MYPICYPSQVTAKQNFVQSRQVSSFSSASRNKRSTQAAGRILLRLCARLDRSSVGLGDLLIFVFISLCRRVPDAMVSKYSRIRITALSITPAIFWEVLIVSRSLRHQIVHWYGEPTCVFKKVSCKTSVHWLKECLFCKKWNDWKTASKWPSQWQWLSW